LAGCGKLKLIEKADAPVEAGAALVEEGAIKLREGVVEVGSPSAGCFALPSGPDDGFEGSI